MQKSNLFGGSLTKSKETAETMDQIPDVIKDTEIVKLKEAQLLAPELFEEKRESLAALQKQAEKPIENKQEGNKEGDRAEDKGESDTGVVQNAEKTVLSAAALLGAADLDALFQDSKEVDPLALKNALNPSKPSGLQNADDLYMHKQEGKESAFSSGILSEQKNQAGEQKNLSEAMQNEVKKTGTASGSTVEEGKVPESGSAEATDHANLSTSALNPDAGIKAEPPRQLSFIDEQKFTESMSEGKTQTETVKEAFMMKGNVKRHRIIGQLFATYWLVEMDNQLFIIDQHAAHEKILYETTLKRRKDKEFLSQMISPPIVLTLSLKEEAAVMEHMDVLKELGFEIEHFGGKEYAVSALPADMYGIAGERLLIDFIDDLVDEAPRGTPEIIFEKIASMSCKAAVKGNQKLSYMEAESLIDQLLALDNPFHCPHGRPVIISMTKYEIEKKFKRIV
ncbi:MAG: hypothetical protein E7256_02590 [Lachnospiraceae bacterium]|nr:hypothetical protein [Lachnospiraceae bacterium]